MAKVMFLRDILVIFILAYFDTTECKKPQDAIIDKIESQYKGYDGRPVPPELIDMIVQKPNGDDVLENCMDNFGGCMAVHKTYKVCGFSKATSQYKIFNNLCEFDYTSCRNKDLRWMMLPEKSCPGLNIKLEDDLGAHHTIQVDVTEPSDYSQEDFKPEESSKEEEKPLIEAPTTESEKTLPKDIPVVTTLPTRPIYTPKYAKVIPVSPTTTTPTIKQPTTEPSQTKEKLTAQTTETPEMKRTGSGDPNLKSKFPLLIRKQKFLSDIPQKIRLENFRAMYSRDISDVTTTTEVIPKTNTQHSDYLSPERNKEIDSLIGKIERMLV